MTILTRSTRSLSKWRPHHIRSFSSSPRNDAYDPEPRKKKKKDSDRVRFLNSQLDLTIPYNDLQRSTITPAERDVFQRIFKHIVQNHEKELDGKAVKAGSRQVKPRLKGRKNELDGAREANNKPPAGLVDTANLFPPTLRSIAVSAAKAIEYKNFIHSRKEDMEEKKRAELDPAERQKRDILRKTQDEEVAKIESLLKEAATDVDLWNVMHKNLFEQFAPQQPKQKGDDISKQVRAKVPTKTGQVANKKILKELKNEILLQRQQKEKDTQQQAAKITKVFSVLGPIFPKLLLTAVRELRTRFPSSNLVFSILPVIKAHGPSTYALFCTTDLYNEIVAATWLATADHEVVIGLLQEMDMNGFEYNEGTLRVVRKIKNAGKFRNPVALAYGRMVKTQQGSEGIRAWRRLIAERMESLQIRNANVESAQTAELEDTEDDGPNEVPEEGAIAQ